MVTNQNRNMLGFRYLSKEDVEKIQKYYDDNHTLRECQEVFGHCRATLIKYLKTRSRTKLHDKQKRRRNVEGVTNWRKRTKERLVEYKGGKCEVCGYHRCLSCLDFHHINPQEKEFTISSRTCSIEILKKEVDKCKLLCSNCHGEVHSGIILI